MHISVTAVVPAAGSGSRMAGPVPKQYLPLGGRPMLEWTLLSLSSATEVTAIVLAVPPDDVAKISAAYLRNPAFPKVAIVTGGGKTRTESVRNGVLTAAGSEWILTHDAARPFVSPALIRRTVEAAFRAGAATAAIPAHDTLKRRQGDFLGEPVDRSLVLQIQTPQVFRRDNLLSAHSAAGGKGEFTDETSLLQSAGFRVAWVEGEKANMKITTAEDLALAEIVVAGNPLYRGSRQP